MVLENVCVVKFNSPNKNGRVYSPDCFNLDEPILKEKLACGMLLGELGFPEDREEVDISKVSHVIKNLYKREDGLYADIETLNTPNGRVLEQIVSECNFLEQTVDNCNFRTRGSGNLSLRDDGYYDVTDYTFITIDYTSNPA